jgi:hypothetical protein
MEEDASKSVAQAKKRAVKKRPALANLSNQQIVVSRNALGGGAGGKEQQQQNALKLAAKVETVVVEPGNENAVGVERVVVADFSQQQQNRPPLQEASAAAIASLERRTVQNLYISKDEETDLELEDGRERENVCISKINLHARMQFSLGRLFSLVWVFALLLVDRKQTGLHYIVLHLYGDRFGRVCEELSEKKGENVLLRLGEFFPFKVSRREGFRVLQQEFLMASFA